MIRNDYRQTTACVDYDLHSVVGVRLIDASPGDLADISRQIGDFRIATELSRTPDITVRFVRELPLGHRLRHISYGSSGSSDGNFYLLRHGRKATRVRIDFAQLGEGCEILCQTGMGSVPLLIALVNVCALGKGFVPLHASAFVHEGVGAIVTGWAKGGKTEALLAFANHGARYVGDEWILLSNDGRHVFGIPENMRLWEWHLQNIPLLFRELKPGERWTFRGIHALDWLSTRAPRFLNHTPPFKALRLAMPTLKRQLNVRVPPHEIFKELTGPFSAEPEKVFFMVSHTSPEIEIERCDPLDLTRRMVASVSYEQLPLMSAYMEYKFAFPHASNSLLDNAQILQADLLCRALAGKDAYTVRHPYPVSFSDLYHAMVPHMTRRVASPNYAA